MGAIVASVRQVLQEAGLQTDAGLVVAASGGVDSTVLLDVLDGLGYRLHVAHLDHALRPDSADDSRFVTDEAKRRRLPCSVERRDVRAYARTEGLSLEEAGRRQRYAFLDQVADRVRAEFIALGHHADDQAETVIMRLLRGSGATGLGGMEIAREGRYLRPLLRVRRAEIEKYARQRGLRYREDPSNRDPRFLRNRVRRELMPLLESYNTKIAEVLNRTAALLKAEDDLLAELTQEALDTVICERCNDKVALDSTRLLTYHIAMQRRMLRAVLQGLAATENPFDFVRIEQVRSWIGAGDKRLQVLGAGLTGQGCGTRYILRRGRRSAGRALSRHTRCTGAKRVRSENPRPSRFPRALRQGPARGRTGGFRRGSPRRAGASAQPAAGRSLPAAGHGRAQKTERLSHRRQVAENLARRSAGADPGRGNSLGRAFAF